MKMDDRNRKIIFVELLIAFILIIPIFIFFPRDYTNEAKKENIYALKTAKSWSGTTDIDYNDYYGVDSYSQDNIKWDFDRIPGYIDIIVLVMDSSEYSNFISDVFNDGLAPTINSGNYKMLSDGLKNSGIYDLPYSDIWHVLFVNLDSLQETVRCDYDIEWDPYDYSIFGNSTTFPLIFMGIFASALFCAVFSVVITSKHRNKTTLTSNKNPYIIKTEKNHTQVSNMISIVSNNQSFELEKAVPSFCMYCGEKLDKDSVFCSQCGSKL